MKCVPQVKEEAGAVLNKAMGLVTGTAERVWVVRAMKGQ